MQIKMCVWCEESPAMRDDVLCASCKRDEEEAIREIYRRELLENEDEPSQNINEDDNLPF